MKKIVFVLSLLALTSSVVISCNNDREQVSQSKKDVVTKENLALSGEFVAVREVVFDSNGEVVREGIPGTETGPYYYNSITFKNDGTYGYSYQEKSTDMLLQESNHKYEIDGNTLYFYDEDGSKNSMEVLEFVKGDYIKLKSEVDEEDESGKIQKVIIFTKYEVK